VSEDRIYLEYFGVDLDLVWNVVGQELAALAAAVEDLLARLPG
jgi:uncharacterized protein with HEPN domain